MVDQFKPGDMVQLRATPINRDWARRYKFVGPYRIKGWSREAPECFELEGFDWIALPQRLELIKENPW